MLGAGTDSMVSLSPSILNLRLCAVPFQASFHEASTVVTNSSPYRDGATSGSINHRVPCHVQVAAPPLHSTIVRRADSPIRGHVRSEAPFLSGQESYPRQQGRRGSAAARTYPVRRRSRLAPGGGLR